MRTGCKSNCCCRIIYNIDYSKMSGSGNDFIIQDARMIEKSKHAMLPGAGPSKFRIARNKFYYCLLLIIALSLVSINFVDAQDRLPDSTHTVKNIAGEGACIIEGMTAEQARLVALQRARAMVIEQSAGVLVSSSTLVKDFALSADFIKTYSKGFITKEQIEWLPPRSISKRRLFGSNT